YPIYVHQLAAVARRRSGLDERRAADLLVPSGAYACDNQLPTIVVDDETIAVEDDEAGDASAPLLRHGLCLPQSFTAFCVQATELPVAAQPVDKAVTNYRCGHDGVETIGLNLAVALALPLNRCRRLVSVERQHQRTAFERR